MAFAISLDKKRGKNSFQSAYIDENVCNFFHKLRISLRQSNFYIFNISAAWCMQH